MVGNTALNKYHIAVYTTSFHCYYEVDIYISRYILIIILTTTVICYYLYTSTFVLSS